MANKIVVYTPEQIAEILQVNLITVHRWLRAGKLVGVKIGRRLWRIRKESLDEFLDSKRFG